MKTRNSSTAGHQGSKFSDQVREQLGRETGYRCANPDCLMGDLLISPTHAIGKAAHDSGRRPGSARYDPDMDDQARNSASNGAYLCGRCHDMVDAPGWQERYPAGTISDWQKQAAKKAWGPVFEPWRVNIDREGAMDALRKFLRMFDGLWIDREKMIWPGPTLEGIDACVKAWTQGSGPVRSAHDPNPDLSGRYEQNKRVQNDAIKALDAIRAEVTRDESIWRRTD